MKTFKRVLILVLLVIIAIFSVQNTQIVDVHFLVWDWQISRALVIFLSFAFGLVIGIFRAGIR